MFLSLKNKKNLFKSDLFIQGISDETINMMSLQDKESSLVLSRIFRRTVNDNYTIFSDLNFPHIQRRRFMRSNKEGAERFINILFDQGHRVLITPHHNLSLTQKVIDNLEEFSLYWERYTKFHEAITIEVYQDGDPFVLFIKDGNLLGVYCIVPAFVIGDGESTIQELIVALKDRRSKNVLYQQYKLEKIDNTLNMEHIPIKGEVVQLKLSRQIKYGAQYLSITDLIQDQYDSLIKDVNKIVDKKYFLVLSCFSKNILAGVHDKTLVIDNIKQGANIYRHFLAEARFNISSIIKDNFISNAFDKEIYKKAKIYKNSHFTRVSQLIILKEAAYQLGLKSRVLDTRTLLIEDPLNDTRCLFWGGMSQFTTLQARQLADNKHLTKMLLDEYGIRVPKGRLFKIGEYDKASQYISNFNGSAFIVKPLNLMGGRGVSTDIFDHNQLLMAWQRCEQLKCSNIIVEEQILGDDYRVLVVKNKVYAVARRIAPYVIGNGRDNIRELVELKNIERRKNKYLRNSPVVISSYVEQYLSQQGINLNTVPEKGQRVNLSKVSNAGSGGEIVDCSDNVHIDWIPIAVKIRELMANAYHVGIDFLMEDISKSPSDQKWGVIEVNTNPDFAVHLFPSEGMPRNVGKPFLEEIFSPSPQNKFVYRLKILGKVQGVGYRKWFKQVCEFRSVFGYIKNTSSADIVDALIVGYKNNLDETVELSYRGPKNADVRQVIVDDLTDNIEEYRSLQSFEIKVTD
ncbi:acylphosphatase [Ignatzschineria cameli]|uniref:acylphosphatase n=1 Tax=Ignatzschineria cameli TaxID=2182793 RepID=A0A2U2ASY7_9GAMM|nr:acylphosphatase [Ignatzschineria cameli]PWD87745.1 hypothetical protein DC077_00200 [Ignatzschineria cameli]